MNDTDYILEFVAFSFSLLFVGAFIWYLFMEFLQYIAN